LFRILHLYCNHILTFSNLFVSPSVISRFQDGDVVLQVILFNERGSTQNIFRDHFQSAVRSSYSYFMSWF